MLFRSAGLPITLGSLSDYKQIDDFVISVECAPSEATIHIISASQSYENRVAEDYTGAFHSNPLGTFDAGDFIMQQSRHDEFIKQINEWQHDDWQVMLAFHATGELERFEELLADSPLDTRFLQYFIGNLNQGHPIDSRHNVGLQLRVCVDLCRTARAMVAAMVRGGICVGLKGIQSVFYSPFNGGLKGV